MKRRFLYVEDHEESCDLVRALFKDVEIVCAATGEEAVQMIQNDRSFDLYLIDQCLPDLTGLALCREIRGSEDFTPAVFVSASPTLSIQDVREAGGHGLVRKASPNFFTQLRQTVSDLTGLNWAGQSST